MTLLTGGLACDSCGRPMAAAADRGGGRADNPYCRHCTDRGGALLPFESVLGYLVEHEFMARNGMARAQAEAAARNALSRMPAWRGR
jgi:hypothetical protein